MVQKKAPDKHGSPAEPKGGHARPEKRLYSHPHQDGRGGGSGGGGGGCLKKMLSKSRSMKVLEESLDSPLGTQLVRLGKPPARNKKKRPSPMGLPNYMKSTSSSNAKKELAQESSSSRSSLPTAAHDNVRGPRNSKLSDHSSKKPTSAGGASALKLANFPARKPSSRAVRAPTKRILGIPLCSQMNAIRATCSSTMKETSFPDHLDLNPGATEAEGTSVYKVCPYTYCSLNGHRHAPLPPLKCFLTARRRLLKTQKSMKLRGLPSFRKTEPKKEEAEIGAEQGVSSLVEDLGDDFFVEIYAKCPTDAPVSDGGSHQVAHPGAAGGMLSAGDGGEGWGAQIEEDPENLIDESRSQITSEDSFDQISQFSPSEMEVLINFLEFVECDSEDPPCTTQDHGDYWNWDGCALRDTDELGSELAEEEGVCEPEEEDEGLYIDFDEIDYSEFAEDESSDGTVFPLPGVDGSDEEADEIVADDEGRTGSEETIDADKSNLEELLGGKNKVELEDMLENKKIEAVGEETEDPLAARNPGPIGDPCEEAAPADERIDNLFSDAHAIDNTEEKQEKMQRDQNDNASVIEMETWESEEEGEESPVFEEGPDENDNKRDEPPPPELSLDTSTNAACPQAVAAIGTTAATGSVEENHTNGRGMVIGKRASGDTEEEELRGFNPRAPNFLPVEPDPEAEKVDLRHQMMDDRKNSEEWMVDYALRRAVDKLAPGRKRKVALLVEAFETVAPVPAYGSSLDHSTVGLAPIQACS
ncbi:hypothetical protein Taro_022273 [Colocasia esculenta]|uniref:Calmodulin-binding domain-containing protein n=1 Tax=Colocasia esculenta TaxID=4460 RepID=A0A843V0Z9_COLES|nr:hypothetical protein [Colocasia esculenta]